MLDSISRRLFLGVVYTATLLGLISGANVSAQGKDMGDDVQVYVYRDMPEDGQVDKRSKTESYFTPFLFMPADGASQITVDPRFPIADISPNETGTCIEMFFNLGGGGEFLIAGFQPGSRVGEAPPLDIVKEGLIVGSGRPVFLKFRARTETGRTAKIGFESCGYKSGRVRDGIKSVKTPEPKLTVLNGNWRDISIDLTEDSAGLTSLACPLKAVARTADNPGQREVTIYLDDVRFEVTRPVSK